MRTWVGVLALAAMVASLPGTLSAQSEDLGVLNEQVAILYKAGKYADALALAQRAFDVAQKSNAAEPVIAAALDNLALLYKVQGRFAEAEPLYKRALEIHKKRPFDPDLPTALNNLALLYDAEGRYAEAEAFYTRAIDLWEKALGRDDLAVATGRNNLGLLYYHQGRYAEAEPLYKRALEIRKKALGPDDAAVALSLNNLALLYEHQEDRIAEAEPLYKQALAIAEKALPPDHPSLARIRENLGGLYKSLHRRGEAEPLLKNALTAKEQAFGRDNPNLASTLAQLGDLYRQNGDCSEADKQFQRARAIGGLMIKEVPVLFGTDRKRDDSKPSLAFGRERAQTMSFGSVIVPVSNPQTPPQTARQGAVAKGATSIASTEANAAERIPLNCPVLVSDFATLVEDTDRFAAKQALVFVHGYNVSFESAVVRAAQITYDTKFDGNMFVFSWPSHEQLLDYLTDTQTVDIAVEDLNDFLQKIATDAKPAKIYFIAHSMGNKVLLRALEKLTGENPGLRPLIGEVINAAPDVDPVFFAKEVKEIIGKDGIAELEKKVRPAGNFTLYAAQSDLALRVSSWIWGPRAGLIYGKPLVATGFDTIDVTNGGHSVWRYFDFNHSIYLSCPTIVTDMQRIIERNTHPPDKRTTEFETVVSPDGPYWSLRPPQAPATQ